MGGAQLTTASATQVPKINVYAYRSASCGYDGAWIGSGGGVTLNWKMHLSEWKLSGTRLLDELSSELSDDDGLC